MMKCAFRGEYCLCGSCCDSSPHAEGVCEVEERADGSSGGHEESLDGHSFELGESTVAICALEVCYSLVDMNHIWVYLMLTGPWSIGLRCVHAKGEATVCT